MKRFGILMIAFIIGIFASVNCFGQKRVYCEIIGWQKLMNSNEVGKIDIDFGQKRSVWGNHSLVDENGKTIKFNSMVDAMNFMSEKGWELVSTYHDTSRIHWVLVNIIDDEEELHFDTKNNTKKKKD